MPRIKLGKSENKTVTICKSVKHLIFTWMFCSD